MRWLVVYAEGHTTAPQPRATEPTLPAAEPPPSETSSPRGPSWVPWVVALGLLAAAALAVEWLLVQLPSDYPM